jgi:tetratricopeptide (TPR) repeat protein
VLTEGLFAMRFHHAAPLFLALLASPLVASAQTRDPVTAEALFRQGREAMKRGDFHEARVKLGESQRLDPAVGTLLNLAECEEETGRVASAWQHYQEAVDQLSSTDPRHAVASRGVIRLEKRVPRVTIQVAKGTPADVTVVRDGIRLGRASLGTALPVDPGSHEIIVSAPNYSEKRFTFHVDENETKTVEVTVGGPARSESTAATPDPSGHGTDVAQPAAQQPTRDKGSSGSSTQSTLGYVVGGLGLIGVGAGAYFALDAKSKDERALDYCSGTSCSDQRGVDLTNQSRDAARYSAIAFVAGGVGVATGLVLVLTAPTGDDKAGSAASLELHPDVGHNLLGVRVGGAW